MRFLIKVWGLILISCWVAAVAHAEWPERPVRIVVPYGPGGTPDTILRPVIELLSQRLGQPFLIDNKPGGGGTLGTGAVARSAPDGYTFAYASVGTHSTVHAMVKDLSYDPVKDFVPIGFLAVFPTVLIVNTSSGINNVEDLIAKARANPGKMNYASAGFGTNTHLSAEMFMRSAKFEAMHVPYKDGASAMTSLIAGDVQFFFNNMNPSVMALVNAGRLKVIAIATEKHLPQLPSVRTMAELGYPNVRVIPWAGIFAPAGTPRPIVERFSKVLREVLRSDVFDQKMTAIGAEVRSSTPEELASFLKEDIARWTNVIQAVGITPQ
jgi:tripartite-type tricarboxylate transporter receptor subunit TctC